jgi:hypothetical protein
MTQTTIYLSVINGKDTLTLDGNLYLFRELLTTLNNTVKKMPQTDAESANVNIPVRAYEVNQEVNHDTD